MIKWSTIVLLSLVLTVFSESTESLAQDPAAETKPDTTTAEKPAEKPLPEGHSYHGEVFNEGPRQAAYLIEGVGVVRFPVTTASEDARKFFEQGVAQLHGFWFFESERSFRQAATIDPEMAMAYWGMALSNKSNADRAKGFIKEAVSRKEKSSPREQKFIEAFDRYINAAAGSKEERQKRAERYAGDLDDIILEFPEDIEARAFLVDFFWTSRGDGLETASYHVIDSLIEDVLDVEPLHPVHHYRIHLWDNKKPEKALESAARCGLAAPAIAHMWHMPGHIYSRVKRYHDAVYQQEASARVDHAHMMRDRVIPDQIHNFAHNNEWCIRNLIHIGRVSDAIALSQNMMSMPMHPKYNHIDKFGSFRYGRQRLLEVLTTYDLNEELIRLQAAGWLDATGNEGEDLAAERAIGAAFASLGRTEQADAIRAKFQGLLDDQKAKQKEAGDAADKKAREEKKDDKEIEKARKEAEEKFRTRINDLEHAIEEIDGRKAAYAGNFEPALELLKKAGGIRVEQQIALMLKAGKTEDAVKRAQEHVQSNKNEVLPLACQVETLWTAGKKEEARAAFDELRKISSTIDLTIPAFARLTPAATELGLPGDWRLAYERPADLGARPDLDALGPFRWEPVSAPSWTLPDVASAQRSLSDYHGRPVVVIFYLGYGCLHCAEQLQKFAPKYEEFQKAGFEVIAVSTDKQENLRRAFESLEKPFGFPLVADPEMTVFRQYRCFDDFEKVALHGTFIIDGNGRIRWQDISYEPFMDVDFVLKEGQRLLKLDEKITPSTTPSATVAASESR
ncbi:MAG: redoxin domain-containing protein [Planctomyces sp.]|nr:redoxin domain-containing protein [Planctomyces sp.]